MLGHRKQFHQSLTIRGMEGLGFGVSLREWIPDQGATWTASVDMRDTINWLKGRWGLGFGQCFLLVVVCAGVCMYDS